MNQAIVYVVDDDLAMRESLHWLISSVGIQVRTFGSATEFLANLPPQPSGCLLLDVRMPGPSGLELQDILRQRRIALPIIFISGHGDVPMAVRAMKKGAMDFVEKPFNDQQLLDLIHRALLNERQQREQHQQREQIRTRLGELTKREREVLDGVVAGKVNKQIAADLGLSIKTVETHRARVMDKLAADSLADLIRMILLTKDEN